jgi:hypothetical protein
MAVRSAGGVRSGAAPARHRDLQVVAAGVGHRHYEIAALDGLGHLDDMVLDVDAAVTA